MEKAKNTFTFIKIRSKQKGLLGELQNRFLKYFEDEANRAFEKNLLEDIKKITSL